MSDQMVAIKGIRDGLLVSLNASEDWSAMTADLAERIDKQSSFFAGARITVDVGERPRVPHSRRVAGLQPIKRCLGNLPGHVQGR